MKKLISITAVIAMMLSCGTNPVYENEKDVDNDVLLNDQTSYEKCIAQCDMFDKANDQFCATEKQNTLNNCNFQNPTNPTKCEIEANMYYQKCMVTNAQEADNCAQDCRFDIFDSYQIDCDVSTECEAECMAVCKETAENCAEICEY